MNKCLGAVLATVVLTSIGWYMYARHTNARLRAEADNVAAFYKIHLDSANQRIRVQQEQIDELNNSLIAYIDSVTVLSEPVPVTPPEVEVVLDTTTLNAQVAAAVASIRQERNALREENTALRQTITDLRTETARVFAEMQRLREEEIQLYKERLALADETIKELQHIIDQATGTSLYERLAWAGGGAVLGFLTGG